MIFCFPIPSCALVLRCVLRLIPLCAVSLTLGGALRQRKNFLLRVAWLYLFLLIPAAEFFSPACWWRSGSGMWVINGTAHPCSGGLRPSGRGSGVGGLNLILGGGSVPGLQVMLAGR